MANKRTINHALDSIFEGINELRKIYKGKLFTIDGRLVGDIGEIIIAQNYDIQLFEVQTTLHDGMTSNNRKVQIKATFQDKLTLDDIPDYYLGIKIFENGDFEEIYNGPGKLIFQKYSHRKGIGEKQLSFPINALKEISKTVPEKQRVPRRKSPRVA